MDEEDLYDSLDELDESSGAEPKLNAARSTPNFRYDIGSLVPLYGRETLKDYIKPPKRSVRKSKSKIPVPNSKKNAFGCSQVRTMRTNYRKPSTGVGDEVTYNKGGKSYTTMFRTRIGQTKKGVSDTARAQCGDSTHRTDDSSISAATHYSDAQSSVSDSTSFYLKLIEDHRGEPSKTMSNLSSNTDMRSVSEYSVNNPKKKRATKKVVPLVVPVLGGLGPDTASNREKLTRLRKQNSYGQKASTQNRIKMMEVKVLKDLKREMKNSSFVDKAVGNLLSS